MFPNLNTSAEHFATLPSYIVVLFQQITLKPGNYGIFWPSFQRCRQIVTNSSLCQKLKKTVEGSIRPYNVFQKLNRSWNNHDEVERLSNIFIRNNDGNDNVKKHNFLQKVYEGLY